MALYSYPHIKTRIQASSTMRLMALCEEPVLQRKFKNSTTLQLFLLEASHQVVKLFNSRKIRVVRQRNKDLTVSICRVKTAQEALLRWSFKQMAALDTFQTNQEQPQRMVGTTRGAPCMAKGMSRGTMRYHSSKRIQWIVWKIVSYRLEQESIIPIKRTISRSSTRMQPRTKWHPSGMVSALKDLLLETVISETKTTTRIWWLTRV